MFRWTIEKVKHPGSIHERPAGEYVRQSFSKGMGPPTKEERKDQSDVDQLKKDGFVLWKADHGRQWSEITYFKPLDPGFCHSCHYTTCQCKKEEL